MRHKSLNIILCIMIACIATSCNIGRHVPEGKHLVRQNNIDFDKKQKQVKKSALSPYIAKKPCWSLLSPNFRLWAYYISENKRDKSFWNWVNEKIGREPTYYDKDESDIASKQMELYLNHIGHFNSKVTSEAKTHRFTARVKYNIALSQPYTINSFDRDITDTAIARQVSRIESNFPIKAGDTYDEYKLNKVRDQITEHLRNRGYYYFSRDYISYEVDSSFNNHTLSVTMKIADFKDPKSGTTGPHRLYKINRIDIYPDHSALMNAPDNAILDSLSTSMGRNNRPNKMLFHYASKPYIRPQTFSQAIQIRTGGNYSLRRTSNTYSALNNFKAFSNTNITFDEVPDTPDSVYLLNCRITMQKADRHSYTLQVEGTRADSDLGIKGGISYTNRNLFRGAEMLQLSVRGGLEFQNTQKFLTTDTVRRTFNTKELNLTTRLLFPRFFSPIQLRNFAYNYQPKTTITLGYNWQKRYYYTRHILTTSFGYDWKSSSNLQHILTPININTVKITNMDELFKLLLVFDDNQRRKDQYTDHLIFGARYSLIYNTQSTRKDDSFIYLRADFETSGNLISLFNNTRMISQEDSFYKLLGIRYAQFARVCFDFRQHFNIANETWFVVREVVGLGIPYGNSRDMPFERCFYAGGANGMRGWNYRSLGPGAYEPQSKNIEQISDMQLEFNAEFRFPIYSVVKGGAFVDIGNIWNYHPNASLPNGEFKFQTFYKQFAVDAGLGIRLDINFLVVRADLAMPLRNPYPNDLGQHWRFKEMKPQDLHLQIGIGYPF